MADLSQLSNAELMAAYQSAQSPLQSMSDADLQAAYQAANPVTATDRAHAAEGGILGGLAYTATAVPDAVANTYNLGKAALSGLSSGPAPPGAKAAVANAKYNGGQLPESTAALPPDIGNAFPVGSWLTSQMDKNPLTSTQAPRPDDTLSRYLNTAGNVAGGVAPASKVAQLARSLAIATPPALAGRYVAESKPFESDSANNVATLLTQALGTGATGKMLGARGALLPENQIKNDAVTAGQERGYVFPIGTTNPTRGNVAVTTLGGKTTTEQNMSIKNQPVTNEGARADMGLPPGKGGSITDLELETAKADAAPGYDALRSAGQINAPKDFDAKLGAAMAKQSGAGRLSTKLADSDLATIVEDIKGKSAFDAGDAMDAIGALRDKASEAYRKGNAQAGAAYKGVSKVLEDAIDSHLSGQGGSAADTMANFRDSRQRFAIIHSVEENRNPTTGNVNAQKLAAALKKKEFLSGNLKVAGQAAGQAPAAFAEPTKTPGNHLGLLGALIGGGELTKLLPDDWEHAGLATLAATAAVPAARMGARQYLYSLGQRNALPRKPGQILTPGVLGGAYAGGVPNVNP